MRSRAFLGLENPVSIERALRVAIGAAIGAVTIPTLGACGSQPVACGGCGCGTADTGSPTPFDVTFELCQTSDAGTSDASDDAASDASTEAGDAGMCFATCDQACASLKPASITSAVICLSTTPDAGVGPLTAHCESEVGLCTGRKLDGLRAPMIACDDPIGAWFAQAAWLEAASVGAFRRLGRELRAHGAPAHLIAMASACAKDEIRHARLMARFAKKHGAVVPRVDVENIGVRDLESIARENAVEGCVGETYGAALAVWESEHATSVDMREAMRAIAGDELRHAALGWAVAAWAEARLDAEARERVSDARRAAARELTTRSALASEVGRRLWAA
jgi:hypothetical protein